MTWVAMCQPAAKGFFVLAGMAVYLFSATPVLAEEDAAEKKAELEQLRKRIKSLQTDLSATARKRRVPSNGWKRSSEKSVPAAGLSGR